MVGLLFEDLRFFDCLVEGLGVSGLGCIISVIALGLATLQDVAIGSQRFSTSEKVPTPSCFRYVRDGILYNSS